MEVMILCGGNKSKEDRRFLFFLVVKIKCTVQVGLKAKEYVTKDVYKDIAGTNMLMIIL